MGKQQINRKLWKYAPQVMEMEKELNLNPKGTSIDGVKEMIFDLGSKRQAKVLTGVRKSLQPNMPNVSRLDNSPLERDSSKEVLWLNRNDSF